MMPQKINDTKWYMAFEKDILGYVGRSYYTSKCIYYLLEFLKYNPSRNNVYEVNLLNSDAFLNRLDSNTKVFMGTLGDIKKYIGTFSL